MRSSMGKGNLQLMSWEFPKGHYTEKSRNMALKCNVCKLFLAILFTAGILLFHGCSIKYSLTGASTEGLKTVSIQTFQNRASLVQPGLNRTITDALIDKCKAQTNLNIV